MSVFNIVLYTGCANNFIVKRRWQTRPVQKIFYEIKGNFIL